MCSLSTSKLTGNGTSVLELRACSSGYERSLSVYQARLQNLGRRKSWLGAIIESVWKGFRSKRGIIDEKLKLNGLSTSSAQQL